MYTETISLKGSGREKEWLDFIERQGLIPDSFPEFTVNAFDDEGKIAATASLDGNIVKFVAVDERARGEDLTAKVLTGISREAFDRGDRHLFLYTKPANRLMFEGLFFYSVASSKNVLLMENIKNGAETFVRSLAENAGAKPEKGNVGAIVMNCDPFTLGHRALAMRAAEECDRVFVFVVSEDRGTFPAEDRFRLAKEGLSDIKNVTVMQTGPYLVSQATFPTYFLKDRDGASHAKCGIDMEIFVKYFAKTFGITKRFVGSEPISALTRKYNEAMKEFLPKKGIEVKEIERVKSSEEGEIISASLVRKLFSEGKTDEIRNLVPEATFDYLRKRYAQGGLDVSN